MKLVREIIGRRPLRPILRPVVQKLSLLPYRDRLELNWIDRPHYGHCIFEAVQLAARLHVPRISVIEFGCGGGNGLVNAEMHISEAKKIFPVDVELYGFDTGAGMPVPQDYRDFPHYFKPGLYKMDPDLLRRKLRFAKLVLGPVKETCNTFISEYDPAPIGCVFHDLDFYSSTADALTIFDADPARFLPRIYMYFDDIKGSHVWAVSEFAGELLAIDEFNRNHAFKKIAADRSMPLYYPDQMWADQIYIYHDFHHPQYNVYVADEDQIAHENQIALR
jgi:hypothetical protein